MAPYTAAESRVKSSKPTSVPRIVPAVPLKFTRPAVPKQPITPVESEPATTELAEAKENTVKSDEVKTVVRPAASEPLTPEAQPSATEEAASSEEIANGVTSFEAKEAAGSQEEAPAVPDAELPVDDVAVETHTEEQQHTVDGAQQPISQLPQIHDRGTTPSQPSQTTSTPTSTTSSAAPQHQISQTNSIAMHHPRPNAGGIVFGEYPNSSHNSPAPPPGGVAAFPPQPPPGFAAPNFAHPAFFAPGHVQHPSDSPIPMMYHPIAVPQQGQYDVRRDRHGPALPFHQQLWIPPQDVRMQPRVTPQDTFPPQRVAPYMNGNTHTPRSPSVASSRAHEQDIVGRLTPAIQQHTQQVPQTNQNGASVPVQFPHRPSPQEESLVALQDYLRSQFGSRDFADYVMEVVEHTRGDLLLSIPLHGVLAARSPTLRSLMSSAASRDAHGLKVLSLSVEDKFLIGPVLAEALQYLYGAPLLQLEKVSAGLPPFVDDIQYSAESAGAKQRMGHALAFAAAGHLLRVESVSDRGIDIARAILRWDTIGQALSFSLSGGLAPIWLKEEDWNHIYGGAPSAPSYGDYSTRLLQFVIGFLAHNIPSDFSFGSSATQLANAPRLPPVAEPRRSFHNPRLSQIRFGDVPVEESSQPSYIDSVISSILISLPFPILSALFEHEAFVQRLTSPKIVEILETVVAEREARRKRLFERGIPRGAPGLWQSVMFEERVEVRKQHPLGAKLITSRVK